MAQPISRFFKELGLPFRNDRWSWGARDGNVILLRTWGDEFGVKPRRVVVLQEPSGYEGYLETGSYGLDERIAHLRSMWEGGIAAYTVTANAVDPNVFGRTIKDYRDDKVFVIKQLMPQADGAIWALLDDELVPVKALREHSKTHLTQAGVGPFPVDESLQTGTSTSGYQEKLPAIREWLIGTSRQGGVVTYGELMTRFGFTFFILRHAMGRLGHACRDAGEPIITALIVSKDDGKCSDGFRTEFGIEDDQAERERCYAHWAEQSTSGTQRGTSTSSRPAAENSFEELARRFAQVEVRPNQPKFRDAVFRACGGKCVVSGCDVPEALDAAHLTGRNWRDGHNEASDGVLLRRDLHGLYDRGLLVLTEDGGVQLDAKVLAHYGHLLGNADVKPKS